MRSSRIALLLPAVVVVSVATVLSAQAPSVVGGVHFYPDDPLWIDDDMRSIAEPVLHDLSKSYEFVANTFTDTARSFGPALNVNTLGEVPDSSWFTNRIGVHPMTIAEVVRGPNRSDGPAPGMWLVTHRSDAGITPKFTVRDSRGDVYVIKLDPASNPELPSSVELISTKLFHAIGYHVPEDFLVHFRPEDLRPEPSARMRNAVGDSVAIRPSDIRSWLRDVPRRPDGTYRAIASLWVPGKVVGQFKFNGRRADDPNDLYPHERRRELRGLRLFSAWLNHDDARAINSIDTYVEDNGRRYIRHYLQDFGSNLGSGTTSAQQPRGGYEYLIEPGRIGKGLAGLGFYRRAWMAIDWPADPTIGNIEAEVFDPSAWKTEYPNPAFKQMDAADAFWAATILSKFTDETIRAVVHEAQLTSPGAARHLGDVIIRRRDKSVRWGITGTNPIDRFALRAGQAPELVFDNAAVRLGFASPTATYEITWAPFDNTAGEVGPSRVTFRTGHLSVPLPADAWGPADRFGIRYAVATIATHHRDFPAWTSPVVVTLRTRSGVPDVVGIDRTGGRPGPGATDVARHRH